jgi:hypothetical protein
VSDDLEHVLASAALVHDALGAGLRPSTYEAAVAAALDRRGIDPGSLAWRVVDALDERTVEHFRGTLRASGEPAGVLLAFAPAEPEVLCVVAEGTP